MTQALAPLTTGEAALRLGVTDETIRRWIAAGKIPAFALPSGQFRIRREDVETIIAGQTVAAAEAAS